MQTSLTERLNAEYKPKLLLAVYEHDHEYYLESHDIDQNGRVMPGKPLLQETIQGMVDVFFDENKNRSQITGMIPENLLHYSPIPGGRYKMVWYRPEEVRYIHLTKSLGNSIKAKSGKSVVPPMIYMASQGGLDVFCYDINSRPGLGTKLCLAPFYNVNDAGDVCLGSAQVEKPKEKTYQSLMNYWEALFWQSEFTHLNGGDKKATLPMSELWNKMLNSKCRMKWQGQGLLKAMSKKTVNDLIK